MSTHRTSRRVLAASALALSATLAGGTTAYAEETCPPPAPTEAPAPTTSEAPTPTSTVAPAPTSTAAPSPTSMQAPEPSTTATTTPTTEPTVAPSGTPEPTAAPTDCGGCRTVTPPTPAQIPVCGPNNDVVSMPAAAGVIWDGGSWADNAITVKAISADWYTFPTGDVVSWPFVDQAVPCDTPTAGPTVVPSGTPEPGTPTDEPTVVPSGTPEPDMPTVAPSGIPTTAAPAGPLGTPTGPAATGAGVPGATAAAAPIFDSGVDGVLPLGLVVGGGLGASLLAMALLRRRALS
ncbi:hypothetical protein [Arsenicicoccus dermatophilus]|uniref:hypothetical protein n=1 Tax=Arsenicicoccus dermatophilus TaxID=1076331 RepID=UPI001F4C58DF|nr:hypothetical protein [Arsenicicoccus dermatophilus]MCH8614010.1 hypothetical protein [Arsenicicoccus dermatophilus]